MFSESQLESLKLLVIYAMEQGITQEDDPELENICETLKIPLD